MTVWMRGWRSSRPCCQHHEPRQTAPRTRPQRSSSSPRPWARSSAEALAEAEAVRSGPARLRAAESRSPAAAAAAASLTGRWLRSSSPPPTSSSGGCPLARSPPPGVPSRRLRRLRPRHQRGGVAPPLTCSPLQAPCLHHPPQAVPRCSRGRSVASTSQGRTRTSRRGSPMAPASHCGPRPRIRCEEFREVDIISLNSPILAPPALIE